MDNLKHDEKAKHTIVTKLKKMAYNDVISQNSNILKLEHPNL